MFESLYDNLNHLKTEIMDRVRETDAYQRAEQAVELAQDAYDKGSEMVGNTRDMINDVRDDLSKTYETFKEETSETWAKWNEPNGGANDEPTTYVSDFTSRVGDAAENVGDMPGHISDTVRTAAQSASEKIDGLQTQVTTLLNDLFQRVESMQEENSNDQDADSTVNDVENAGDKSVEAESTNHVDDADHDVNVNVNVNIENHNDNHDASDAALQQDAGRPTYEQMEQRIEMLEARLGKMQDLMEMQVELMATQNEQLAEQMNNVETMPDPAEELDGDLLDMQDDATHSTGDDVVENESAGTSTGNFNSNVAEPVGLTDAELEATMARLLDDVERIEARFKQDYEPFDPQEAAAKLVEESDLRHQELNETIERAEQSGLDSDWSDVQRATQRVQEVNQMMDQVLDPQHGGAMDAIRNLRADAGNQDAATFGSRIAEQTARHANDAQQHAMQDAASRTADQVAAAAELQEQDEAAMTEQRRKEDHEESTDRAEAEQAEQQRAEAEAREREEAEQEREQAEREEAEQREQEEQEQVDKGELDPETGEPVDVNRTDPLSDEYVTDLQVEMASLDDESQAKVVEAVEDAQDTGKLDELDTDELVAQEREIADRREEAETHRQDQQRAQEEGDLETARDRADEAREDLQVAAERDGDSTPDREEEFDVVEAENDVDALDAAEWNQDIADENAETAESYAAEGDFEVAEVYEDAAIEAEHDAGEYEDDGDAEYAGSRYDGADTYDS